MRRIVIAIIFSSFCFLTSTNGMEKNEKKSDEKSIELVDWRAHFQLGHHMICEGPGCFDFKYYSHEYSVLGSEVVIHKKYISAVELNKYLSEFVKENKILSLNLYGCKNINLLKIEWKLLKDLREIILVGTNVKFRELIDTLSKYLLKKNSRYNPNFTNEHYYEDIRIFFPKSSRDGMSKGEIKKINNIDGVNSSKSMCRSYRDPSHYEAGWLEGQDNYQNWYTDFANKNTSVYW